jgi:hypothetical protein
MLSNLYIFPPTGLLILGVEVPVHVYADCNGSFIHSANTTQLSSWKYSMREWRALIALFRKTQNQIPLDSAIDARLGMPIISNSLWSFLSCCIHDNRAAVGLETYEAGT